MDMMKLWRSGALVGCLFAFVGICQTAAAQTTAAWTWIGGSSTANQQGTYGQLGIPASGNMPPGRWDAARWTDNSGNLWLFGGSGYSPASNATGVLRNDLWEFSPSSNEWAWMGGSGTVGTPSPGVYGLPGTPAIGNIPGSRSGAVNWTDYKGNLWLFGGSGCDATGNISTLNDLWEYNPATNEWAWVDGSSTAGVNGGRPGVYGTLGTPGAGNIPGGRSGAVSWTDGSGNFWLFGGQGYDAKGVGGGLNDLWKFDLSTNEWIWMGGSDTVPKNGEGWPSVYGTADTPATANMPGSRSGAIGWTDGSGNPWIFGGSGYDENGTLTALNDLSEFRFSSQQWVWMGGSTTSAGCTTYNLGLVTCAGSSGVYGLLGTPSPGNIPGGRAGSVSWMDGSNNLWLFGGQGYDSTGNEGNLNDLWKFNPGANDWTWFGGNTTESGCAILPEGNTFCRGQPGEYGTLGAPGPGNGPGARFGAATWGDKLGNLWLFGGYGADSAGNDMGVLNDMWEYQQSTNALTPAATPTFSPAAGTYSLNQTVFISDATPTATIYFTTDGSAPTTNSTMYSGPIVISSSGTFFSETIEAIAVASGYSSSTMISASYSIKLPPDFSLAGSPDLLAVTAGGSGVVTITVTPVNGFNAAVSFSCSGLPTGASCSFSPAIVTPQLTPKPTTLTVTGSTATAAVDNNFCPLLPAAAVGPLLCCLVWKKRWPLQRMVLLIVFSSGLSLLCGCSSSLTHRSETASVTVTATSGSLHHTSSFTLTLN